MTYLYPTLLFSIKELVFFIFKGKYQIAKMVLTHAKERFPHEFSTWWKMCEQLLYFEYSLHSNLWNDAYKAACQIATVDKKESLLRY